MFLPMDIKLISFYNLVYPIQKRKYKQVDPLLETNNLPNYYQSNPGLKIILP